MTVNATQEQHHVSERNSRSVSQLLATLKFILSPERSFYTLALIYGISISVLTLAVPISVQTLINSVANTAMSRPVIILAVTLFALLLLNAVLYASQKYLMELYERRFFARVSSAIALRSIYAKISYFDRIDRMDLANRFFDIMTIQKSMPTLMTRGYALVLQTVVGLLITSFYHPILFIFNLSSVLILYLIWRIWGHNAIRRSVELSKSKYHAAAWLEEIAQAHTDLKSRYGIQFALERANNLTERYIDARKSLFRHTFAQTIAFLLLYAVMSACLLGIGGLLVIDGELTLGQLVAAELILSAIYYGISRADFLLLLLYEMVAAADKIAEFYRLPPENEGGDHLPKEGPLSLSLEQVEFNWHGTARQFNLVIPAGAKVLADSVDDQLQKRLIDFIRNDCQPDHGRVLISGEDIDDLNLHELRDHFAVLDNFYVMEDTIRHYMTLHNPSITLNTIYDALKAVELYEVVTALPDGIETQLMPTGHPLSSSQILRLKLAIALLGEPSLIVLTDIYDMIAPQRLQRVIERLVADERFTLIYFSHRYDLRGFSHHLLVTPREQRYLPDSDSLQRARAEVISAEEPDVT